eukprot:Nk52_evm21s2640 gene=Nk52_evmTU21s2640
MSDKSGSKSNELLRKLLKDKEEEISNLKKEKNAVEELVLEMHSLLEKVENWEDINAGVESGAGNKSSGMICLKCKKEKKNEKKESKECLKSTVLGSFSKPLSDRNEGKGSHDRRPPEDAQVKEAKVRELRQLNIMITHWCQEVLAKNKSLVAKILELTTSTERQCLSEKDVREKFVEVCRLHEMIADMMKSSEKQRVKAYEECQKLCDRIQLLESENEYLRGAVLELRRNKVG